MQAFLSAAALLLLGLSAWGWGRAFAALARGEDEGWAYPLALGLAALVALGGPLNLLSLARAPALGSLLAAGLFLAWRRRSAVVFHPEDALILAAFAVHAIFLAPAAFFNSHDDFHLYLPDPMRMLATGSLGGDPFGWLGSNAQGAQGFLQSFILMARPFTHIYLFDSALALALTAGLAAQFARRMGAARTGAAAAAALVLLLPAQAVNASAQYSAAALALACVLAAGGAVSARGALPLGLLGGALVALKTTMLPLAAAFIAAHVCVMAARGGPRRALAAAGGVFVAAAAVLLPWLLTHQGALMPHSVTAAAARGAVVLPSFWSELLRGTSFYGGSALLSAALAAGMTAATALTLGKKDAHPARIPAALFCAAAAALLPGYWLLHSHFLLLDVDSVLRYWAPISLAAAPVALILLDRAGLWVLVACALGLAPSFAGRMKALVADRTVISYPFTRESALDMNAFISGSAATRLRAAQGDVPPGEAALAWISAPFFLDFARNKVFVVSEGGLTGPKFDWLDSASPEEAGRRLQALDVRYVLWQRQGLGVKSEADLTELADSIYGSWRLTGARQLALRRAFARLAAERRVLRDDGGLLVIDLEAKAAR